MSTSLPSLPSEEQCTSLGCCAPSRRDFLQAAGLGALAAGMPVMAGPFAEESATHIPLDKKLRPEWVAALTAKGEPETYSGRDLRFIGMPVGGIFTGTLYLGGDGRLWLWDVFNQSTEGIDPKTVTYHGQQVGPNSGCTYVSPPEQHSPLSQGFLLHVHAGDREVVRRLDRHGFSQVTFLGQYPIGTVTYADPDVPVSIRLETFSPFVPLDAEDSGLPATVLHFTLKNTSDAAVEATLGGWLENAVCLHSHGRPGVRRHNRIVRDGELTSLVCSARAPALRRKSERPDVVFETWQHETYEGWKVEGTAFGPGPVSRKDIPDYQGDVGGEGERVVQSHNARASKSVRAADDHTGKLTSKPFTIERDYIIFFIGGGAHAGATCLKLVVDGKVVRTATGHNANRMRLDAFDVRDLEGKRAHLEIVDAQKGDWGNIGVSTIRFIDRPPRSLDPTILPDWGTMALSLLGAPPAHASASVEETGTLGRSVPEADAPVGERLLGSLARKVSLAPGQQAEVTFILTWHFPNLSVDRFDRAGRHYASRFDSALAVARHVARRFEELAGRTRLWRDTWYGSTLPYWVLNRTFANTSTLATTTCHRFRDGRFWAWEGVGCCAGTCTHVWHYAQAMARLFPAVERDQRERVDLGIGFDARTGGIGHRAEDAMNPAIDGQAGTILRVYREHQMSADGAFLERVWPRVKKAIQYLIERDGNADGILEGAQENTLDAAWFGKIPWLTGLYHAALRAGEEMARERGDHDFARRCHDIFTAGKRRLDEQTFREDYGYYVQLLDPAHADAIATGTGCEIDQVLGQSWAFQVGLGEVMVGRHVRRALESLWKYSFAPDVGPLRSSLPPGVRGRPYAVAGDAGLVMCTWPHGGRRQDWQKHWQYMYFNECMSGFEWQVAGHMIWEGMLTEGLAIARAIHDRYSGKLRNPYNEIECSDHYARAMASYGVFLALCGCEYHGPRSHLGFAPRLTPENFQAAFTAAEGWGTFTQKRQGNRQTARIDLKFGKLRLRTLALALPEGHTAKEAMANVGGKKVTVEHRQEGTRLLLTFAEEVRLKAAERLGVEIEMARGRLEPRRLRDVKERKASHAPGKAGE
jgi:uncharacterized protein (DUF608 family)